MKQKYNKFLALQKYMNFVCKSHITIRYIIIINVYSISRQALVAGNSFLMYFEMFLEIYI